MFGFTAHAAYRGPHNTIAHAELTLNGGMIMLESFDDSSEYLRRHVKHPDQIGGAETRSVSVRVDNADEVYARAKSAGAEMILAIEDKHYGGRGFTCRDREGDIWEMGAYGPWVAK